MRKGDLLAIIEIWNEVVEEGVTFPQEELLNTQTSGDFFASQTYNAAGVDNDCGEVCGLYILHPNNVEPMGTLVM